jgi:hypothetical protein
MATHIHRIRDFSQPPVSRPGARGDRFGQVGDEDPGQVGGANRPAFEDRQPDHHRLGDPVEDRSEHDPERRAALLVAVRILAIAASEAIDQLVAAEEDQAAGEKAPHDPAMAG